MIVGIDLGTTNSLIACYTPDGPKIIPNRLGKNLTPSVVSVDENGQIYVGEAAKERMLLYPDTAADLRASVPGPPAVPLFSDDRPAVRY